MSLENNVENIVKNYMSSGKIEEKVNEYIDKAVETAVQDLFTGYRSPIGSSIKNQLESVMIPVIEEYDYSKYVVKLDKILTEVLKKTTLEHKKILENFQDFVAFDKPKNINISELFDKWCDYVSQEISTDKLEINFDGNPKYESPICTMEIEDCDGIWSPVERKVSFTCGEDEDLNVRFMISDYGKSEDRWCLSYKLPKDLKSLRNINSFEVFLINLDSFCTEIILDEEYIEVDVDIEEEPAPRF